MKTLLLLAGLLALPASADEEPAECPDGTHRIITDDPYRPFRCARNGEDDILKREAGLQGFSAPPKCPRGTRLAAAGGLQPYRCVRAAAGSSDPELAPLGTDADEGGGPAASAAEIGKGSSRRYVIAGEISCEYPRSFRSRDGWREEVPTVSFVLDNGSRGKQVLFTLSKILPSQAGFIDLEAAVERDKQWQGAKDGESVTVAAIKAQVTAVAGASKTVYVPLGEGAYYTVIYSAPAETYELYLGAFDHLLKTLRMARRPR